MSLIIFKAWFNPLALYTFIWMMMIVLYEMRLMNFVTLSITTWSAILSAFLCFLLGVFTVLSVKKWMKDNDENFANKHMFYKIFSDNGFVLKLSIIIFSIIGLIGAFQHWGVLLKKYGSIADVLIQASMVYRNRVEGDIQGVIPYLGAATHIAIVLSAIYTAYKNKFKFVILLPFIALIIESLAEFARANMILGLFEFLISFFLLRTVIKNQKIESNVGKKKNLVGIIVIFVLIFLTASFIKNLRDSSESFKASGSTINKYKGGLFISPAIYFYSCSHLGVLNNYLRSESEQNYFGEETFLPFYRFISKFDVINKPSYYQRGYYIPMWSNTGTYLRDIHADFGYSGLFIIPYLLGLFSTLFWFRFYQNNRIFDFLILVYINIIIAFTFVGIATKFANWLLSLIGLIILIPVMERIILLKENSKIIHSI